MFHIFHFLQFHMFIGIFNANYPVKKVARLVKNKFVSYLRISQLSRSVQCAYWSQNLLKLNT